MVRRPSLQFASNAKRIRARGLSGVKLLFGHFFTMRCWRGPQLGAVIMHRLRPEERSRSPRRRLYRLAKIALGAGIQAHNCHVMDISDDYVRLNVGGLDVPNEFVLLLSGNGVVRENAYKVVWRRGDQVGAKFVIVVRSGFALQD
jgi:hypothetical protein